MVVWDGVDHICFLKLFSFCGIALSWFSFDFSSCMYNFLSRFLNLTCDPKLLPPWCLFSVSIFNLLKKDVTLSPISILFMTVSNVLTVAKLSIYFQPPKNYNPTITFKSRIYKNLLSFHQPGPSQSMGEGELWEGFSSSFISINNRDKLCLWRYSLSFSSFFKWVMFLRFTSLFYHGQNLSIQYLLFADAWTVSLYVGAILLLMATFIIMLLWVSTVASVSFTCFLGSIIMCPVYLYKHTPSREVGMELWLYQCLHFLFQGDSFYIF